MTDVLIYGTNDLAEILCRSLEMYKSILLRNIVGFVVDDEYYVEEEFCGYSVYRYSELKGKISRDDTEILLAIGYSNMNHNRKRLFEKLTKDNWKIGNYVDPAADVRSRLEGVGNIILDGVTIGVGCNIGHGNVFFTDATIAHHCCIGDFNFFAIRSSVAGRVKISNLCFLGNNCCTRDHIVIKSQTLVGAGSYLDSSTGIPGGVIVPPKSMWITKSSLEMKL